MRAFFVFIFEAEIEHLDLLKIHNNFISNLIEKVVKAEKNPINSDGSRLAEI